VIEPKTRYAGQVDRLGVARVTFVMELTEAVSGDSTGSTKWVFEAVVSGSGRRVLISTISDVRVVGERKSSWCEGTRRRVLYRL